MSLISGKKAEKAVVIIFNILKDNFLINFETSKIFLYWYYKYMHLYFKYFIFINIILHKHEKCY